MERTAAVSRAGGEALAGAGGCRGRLGLPGLSGALAGCRGAGRLLGCRVAGLSSCLVACCLGCSGLMPDRQVAGGAHETGTGDVRRLSLPFCLKINSLPDGDCLPENIFEIFLRN